MGLGLSQINSQISSLHNQNESSADLLQPFDQIISPSNSSSFYLGSEDTQSHHTMLQNKPFQGLMQLPDLQSNTRGSSSTAAAAANLFNFSFFSDNRSNAGNQNHDDQFRTGNGSSESAMTLFSGNLMSDHIGAAGMSSLYNTSTMRNESVLLQMSATELLQASQMCGTTSSDKASNFMASFASSGGGGGGGTHLQDLMNTFANGGADMFGGVATYGHGQEPGGFNASLFNVEEAKFQQNLSMGVSDRLTRDFLGVGSMVRSMGSAISTQREQHVQHHGLDDMGSFDQEVKPASSSSRSFAGGNLQ